MHLDSKDPDHSILEDAIIELYQVFKQNYTKDENFRSRLCQSLMEKTGSSNLVEIVEEIFRKI